jgi:hypothetical protein
MRFSEHPMPQLFGGPAYFARAGKFSFLVVKHKDGWYTSWQDQEKGGSASSTLEGPFISMDQAEAHCRHLFKALQRKQ